MLAETSRLTVTFAEMAMATLSVDWGNRGGLQLSGLLQLVPTAPTQEMVGAGCAREAGMAAKARAAHAAKRNKSEFFMEGDFSLISLHGCEQPPGGQAQQPLCLWRTSVFTADLKADRPRPGHAMESK